jgi:catalase
VTEPTTTQSGAPVASDSHSLTTGPDGVTALHDRYLVEKLASFNRERVPERNPHAKGGGAFGEFEVTEDVSKYTRAAVFQPGAKSEMLLRFSSVAGEQGSPDTWRDVRGYALRFYTTEGNYDIVGNNTPVFFIRDGIKFPDFIHSQKRLGASGLRDADMQWDFWTLSPESAHQVTYVMGDRGLPRSWRHLNGYGSHTYQWINAEGERFWVQYHFKSRQGVELMEAAEAEALAGSDSDYYRRDLYEAIERGEYPVWDAYVQIMSYEEGKTYRYNPFDITKVWPHADFPLIKVGHFTLNRNPQNFFAEIEQAAFSPSNLVPGIDISPDKMLMARVIAYPDAQRARSGTNYNQLPVNTPHAAKVTT